MNDTDPTVIQAELVMCYDMVLDHLYVSHFKLILRDLFLFLLFIYFIIIFNNGKFKG